MVGKPNVDKSASNGASMPTSGLNALDQEREASMADEGGASGAVMEYQSEMSHRTQGNSPFEFLSQWMPSSRNWHLGLAFAACAVGAYAGYVLTRSTLAKAQAGGDLEEKADELGA